MSSKTQFSYEWLKDKVSEGYLEIRSLVAFIFDEIFNLLEESVLYIARVLNIFLRLQWKSDLNTAQNVMYNLYVPTSSGIPSMHNTLVAVIVYLTVAALGAEIGKVITIPAYTFSIGFYTNLGALVAIIQLMFTNRENLKLKLDNGVHLEGGMSVPTVPKKKVPRKKSKS